MSTGTGRRVTPSDRRLLRGYGPAVLILGGFLAIALAVPTVAPEHDVAGSTTTQSASSGSAATSSGPVAATTGGTAGASGTTGTAGGTHTVTTGGSAVPASGGALGKVTGCAGPQVPGDPYSPPCVSFSGNNGGATSPGVTSKDIVITYMNPTDGSKSTDQSIESVTGSYNSVIFPETYAQMINTLQDLVAYFNAHFQLYGRHIVLKVFNGAENSGGTDQSDVQADALQVSQTIKAFAEMNATSAAYVQDLTADHVISFSGLYSNTAYYQQQAPYSWSTTPDCNEIGKDIGAVAVKDLVGHPTSYGGDSVANGQTRRFAVVYDNEPLLKPCVDEVTSQLSAAGQPATTTIGYDTDVSVATATAQSTVQQLINDKITTVLCLCDPVGELLFADDMHNDHYQPEWVIAGAFGTETDDIAQEMPQAEWAHVVVVTSEQALAGKYGSTIAYFAAKSEDPNNALIVNEVDVLYQRLYQIVLGIQLAGPDLTPQSYAQGMWSYRGGDGEYGPQTYDYDGVHQFAPIHKFKIEWYDPAVTSPSDGAQGSWITNGTWYDQPPVPLPIFPDGPQ